MIRVVLALAIGWAAHWSVTQVYRSSVRWEKEARELLSLYALLSPHDDMRCGIAGGCICQMPTLKARAQELVWDRRKEEEERLTRRGGFSIDRVVREITEDQARRGKPIDLGMFE